jgi:hypothetical protein
MDKNLPNKNDNCEYCENTQIYNYKPARKFKKCSNKNCREFLDLANNFKCYCCSKKYCLYHRTIESHNCSSYIPCENKLELLQDKIYKQNIIIQQLKKEFL